MKRTLVRITGVCLTASTALLVGCSEPKATAGSFWGTPGPDETVNIEDIGGRPEHGKPSEGWTSQDSRYRVWKRDWHDKDE